jgi:putative Ca2+/H+ antiporter (TMEM165/GDT1 family)
MAASRDAFSVGAGAFLALGLSTVLAAFVGSALLARLPARVLRWGTVAVFALAGVLLLGQAFI